MTISLMVFMASKFKEKNRDNQSGKSYQFFLLPCYDINANQGVDSPIIAMLDHPLFACGGKRGEAKKQRHCERSVAIPYLQSGSAY
jgi:hypothetical protein